MGARSGPEACRAARGDAEHRSLESRASRRLAAPQVAAAPGRPVTPISSPLTDVVPNFGVGSAAERLPNLQAAAQDGYQLVFGTGFFFGDTLDKVAPKFPNVKFAGIDVNYNTDLPSKPTNVRGIQFKEQEAGYLVGYLAGLVLKQQPGPDVASAIGANTVPAIVRYFGGYRAGVKKADPKATVILSYANDPTFSDQAKCKEVALNQISQKTQIIFTAAGEVAASAR